MTQYVNSSSSNAHRDKHLQMYAAITGKAPEVLPPIAQPTPAYRQWIKGQKHQLQVLAIRMARTAVERVHTSVQHYQRARLQSVSSMPTKAGKAR